MRFFAAIILPLLLLGALTLPGPCPLRVASAATGATGTADTAIERQVRSFEALRKDQDRAKRRDLWLAQEKGFAVLAAKSKGETAARAAFYQARARQELAGRSFLAADRREAARLFGLVADKHSRHAPARESLLRQAQVLKSLGDEQGAQKALNRLIRAYPASNEAARARELAGGQQPAPPVADGKALPSSQKGGAARAASSVTIKNVRWQGKEQKAVVTLELDAGAEYTHAYLPPDAKAKLPARVYLDIADALPGEAVKAGVRPKDLVVTRIRAGASGRGTRVTLECDGIACYAVRSPEDKPRTIEIELSRKRDISGGIAVGKAAGGGKGRVADGGKDDKGGKASVIEQLGLTVQTVMLDPGHGGKDPGAQHNGIVERRFTLAMARRVGALLEKKGFTVLYTRTDNRYISLQDRPDLANRKKADLFVSIHVNANPKSSIRGLETYYLDEAKSDDAVTVAARENAVSVKNISDLQFILTDLMLGSKLKESHKLADCVQGGILKRLKAAKLPAHSNGVRSAPFYVLMGARMPAILVEFGYITNSGDAANLKNENFLQRQAEGLADGILRYREEVSKMAPS